MQTKRLSKPTYYVLQKSSDVKTLADAMQSEHITTKQLGSELNYDQSTASRFKNGKQDIPTEAAFKMVELFNNPFIALDVANRYIQVTAPVINGSKIMKEPLAMVIRTVEEMKEALMASQESYDELSTPVDKLSSNQLEDPLNLIDQLLDVMLYSENSVAYLCDSFDISMQESMAKRNKVWQMKGITK